MTTVTRRTALLASLATLVGATAGCGDGGTAADSDFQWWVDGQPQAELHEQLAKEHADDWGSVSVTFQENSKIGQALQLAHQSGQMPDLTAIAGVEVPIAQLVDQQWFTPLELSDSAVGWLESKKLLSPGIHVFDGKTYSFPVHSGSTNTINWFRLETMIKAGLDPEQPPRTYDEFRRACRKAVDSGAKSGLMLPLKVVGTNENRLGALAQGAGFEGNNGQLFDTGEFAYHSDEWVNALEFLKSLHTDRLLFSGSQNSTVKDGQAKWAAGASAFYWDGPWIPGNIKIRYPQLADKVGSGPPLVPEASTKPALYVNPPGNSYFIPAGTDHVDLANTIMSALASTDYQARYAAIMAHLPLDPEATERSDATPLYKKTAKMLYEQLFRAPQPVIGNLDVAQVQALLKPVKPDAGTIIQGYFSGDVTDPRAALKTLSDESQRAREAAVAAAAEKGVKVSLDAWAFPNWKPRTDYTPDMYTMR